MFPCLGGIRYWPLTARVGLLRAPLDKVVRSCQPWKGGRGSFYTTTRHDSVDGALVAHAPFPFPVEKAVLAIDAGRGEWTAVVNTGFPVGDVIGYLQARARLDLRCEFVGVEWAPHTGVVSANAQFVHYRPAKRLFGSEPPPGDLRWVQASEQDEGWEFDASGPVREYEELDRYTARRRAHRLGYDMLGRYLNAVGVPVDAEDWLGGPVAVAVKPPRGEAASSWSSVPELRRLCGYPEDRIPTELVR
jgi:hypothetical protein